MANIFELTSNDGNITPEKMRKLRQLQRRMMGICSVCLGSLLSMRSFAMDEPRCRIAHCMPPCPPPPFADNNSKLLSVDFGVALPPFSDKIHQALINFVRNIHSNKKFPPTLEKKLPL